MSKNRAMSEPLRLLMAHNMLVEAAGSRTPRPTWNL